uniref:Transport permease protein n=1 Tax=Desulfacinum infernum TaxID=35837 RepID=A0A832A291_9BACT
MRKRSLLTPSAWPLAHLVAEASVAFTHRHIVKGFLAHEISGRYAASAIGIFWSTIHPIAQMLIFSFLFQFVFRVRLVESDVGTSSFTLFFLTAFFPWLMFADALDRASQSLLRHSALVTKVVFPCELLPMSSVLVSFILNGIGFTMVIFYVAYRGQVAPSWLFVPFLVVLEFLFTLGLAYVLASLVVFVRDIQEGLRIFLNIWFYATPILYPASFLPESLTPWLALNPLTFFIDAYRACLLCHTVPWKSLIILGMAALVSYTLGSWFFHRSKRAFADVL